MNFNPYFYLVTGDKSDTKKNKKGQVIRLPF